MSMSEDALGLRGFGQDLDNWTNFFGNFAPVVKI